MRSFDVVVISDTVVEKIIMNVFMLDGIMLPRRVRFVFFRVVFVMGGVCFCLQFTVSKTVIIDNMIFEM